MRAFRVPAAFVQASINAAGTGRLNGQKLCSQTQKAPKLVTA